jgi:hypothetical protein
MDFDVNYTHLSDQSYSKFWNLYLSSTYEINPWKNLYPIPVINHNVVTEW